MTWRRVILLTVCGAVVCGALAGCTPVPSTDPRPPGAAARPSGPPSLVPPPSAPPPPDNGLAPPPAATAVTPTGFAEAFAVSCAGRPGADRVVALLKAKGILVGSTTVTVRVGPLCAGTWQYTVLAVPDREPLQVVTRGTPNALQLVAAGTDVCSVPVRTRHPPGSSRSPTAGD